MLSQKVRHEYFFEILTYVVHLKCLYNILKSAWNSINNGMTNKGMTNNGISNNGMTNGMNNAMAPNFPNFQPPLHEIPSVTE